MSDKEEETTVAEKRGRGRPKKPKSDEPEEPKEKRPRGRPKGSIKTTKTDVPKGPARPRGRPKGSFKKTTKKKAATPSKGYGKRGRPRKDSSSPTKAEDGSGDN